MAYSNYLKDALLDHYRKVSEFTQPTNLYIGLATAEIEADDDGSSVTEVTGDNYARVEVNSNWGAAVNGVGSNDEDIEFPQVGAGGWGTVSHWFLADASTDGNILEFGALNTPREALENDVLRFLAGDITTTLSDA